MYPFYVGVGKQCSKTFLHLQTYKANSFVAINVVCMYLRVLTWNFFHLMLFHLALGFPL